MKTKILLCFAICTIAITQAQTHIFNSLLQSHVSADGTVNYKNLKADEAKLDTYIAYLAKTTPEKNWSVNKQKAFWINAYNAYTIKIILNNYPLKSITDIKKDGKTAWKIPFAVVGNQTYTLDHIEHDILRKNLFDPKIHVGVNCASISCPKLLNKAFTEKNIEAELTKLMVAFINDTSKNKLSKKRVKISSIFNWFKDDFTKNGTVTDYINKFAKTKVNPKAKISYLTYNWGLNGN